MNHKTKYSILIIGFLLGISFFFIVITMYTENKFNKGDDNNGKVGDIKREGEDVNKESNGEQDRNDEDNVLSKDSEVPSNNNLTPEDSFIFSPEQIEKLDFDFKKLAEYLEIQDQTTSDQLFEELNKAALGERLAIVEKYKQKNEKIDNFSWAKEGLQACKNILSNSFTLLKSIVNSFIFIDWWIFNKVNSL